MKGLSKEFFRHFGKGKEAPLLVRAPGRVNLIGEHTDYNLGYVLPVAINRHIMLAGRLREDEKVLIYSLHFKEGIERDISQIKPEVEKCWWNYLMGVIYFLEKGLSSPRGLEILVEGNIPIGAGLSSSAALEVATAFLFVRLTGSTMKPMEVVEIGQRVEKEFLGVPCGIMDQFTSFWGRRGKAIFLDCGSREHEYVDLPQEMKIVLCHSGVKRELAHSQYNRRRWECEEGLKILQKVLPHIDSLSDVSLEDFQFYQDLLPPIIQRRVRHVITENARVLKAVDCLGRKDLKGFGQLLYESHWSLRDDFELSIPELDLLVSLAQKTPGVWGGRLTGGGFGGCTVNLVREEVVEEFKRRVEGEYSGQTGRKLEIYVCESDDGVREIDGEE